jgi:hypothetical protein
MDRGDFQSVSHLTIQDAPACAELALHRVTPVRAQIHVFVAIPHGPQHPADLVIYAH